MSDIDSISKDELLIRVARALSDSTMSGPDGNAFGFCAPGYPEAPGAFAATELEAAILFLQEMT